MVVNMCNQDKKLPEVALTTEELAKKHKEALVKYLEKIDDVIAKGPYKDDWDSLRDHKVPTWYTKAKFGIFIHWGVYSVPAFGEWYPRFMYMPNHEKYGKKFVAHHLETYGPQKEHGYRDFVPMFRAEKYDPSAWADLFEEAGAKFVMPVAEHHDGFQMYDSELSEWCATKKGPMRDCIGELKAELDRRSMVFTTSSHRAEHYWFMSGGREFDSDITGEFPYSDIYWPSYADPYETQAEYDYVKEIDTLFLEDFLARTCEIVDRYHPKILYFDAWIQSECFKPYLKKIAAYYYNRALQWGEEVTINYKFDAFMQSVGTPDIERGQLSNISPTFWQNDTSVGTKSWCYSTTNEFKKTNDILCDLVDIVSKNGSLLLNIGPKADGTIPEEDTKILKEIGAWMKVNGEGIYETTYWKKFGEGPTFVEEGHFMDEKRGAFTEEDFRFTFKDGYLYAFALKWPESGEVHIKSLGRYVRQYCSTILDVEVFGGSNTTFAHENDYLRVSSNVEHVMGPVCMKIKLD
ncbi:MAG: alpha-L-fucosidase [Eubacteriales bacterium]